MDDKSIDVTLQQYEKLGRLGEDSSAIDERLHAAVEAAAEIAQMHPADLGMGDWAAATVKKIKAAVHDEICDSNARKIKSQYQELLDKGTSKEAITSISSLITSVFVALNLAPLAISSVVLYLAIWITKVGLNSWCSRPVDHN